MPNQLALISLFANLSGDDKNVWAIMELVRLRRAALVCNNRRQALNFADTNVKKKLLVDGFT